MRFENRYVELRSLNYHLHECGPADGPAVLCLHGLGDTGASFGPLINAMQRHGPPNLRYIAPDLRGHGDSDRASDGYWFPDYLNDLDSLLASLPSNAPIILVGHSMGGQIASMYAGARPEAVSHLITLDSLNIPDATPDNTAVRYRRWLDALNTPVADRYYDTTEQLAARIGHRYPELSAETCLFLAHIWSRPAANGQRKLACDPRHRWPFPYGFRLTEAQSLWRAVRARTLCIDGQNSPTRRWVNQLDMNQRHACFARLEHKTIAGCGHMLHVEAPDTTARLMAQFLGDEIKTTGIAE